MIELKNISKSYNHHCLFSKINLKIDKPGVYTFFGENGTGKTTILNLISKTIKPSKGRIINKAKSYAFMNQNVSLVNHLTIKQHFEMFKINYKVLNKFHLENKLNRYPSELSYGQKQRILFLLVIYSNSPLIILDEPTSHLDEKNIEIMLKIIKEISKDKIILLVSHEREKVSEISNVIYLLENQRIQIIKEEINAYKLINTKNKIKLHKYNKSIFKKNKKMNLLYFLICFISCLILLFVFFFEVNLVNKVNENKNNSLDYNKFYLSECQKQKKENLIINKCSNLTDKKISYLENNNYHILNNYELMLNALYKTDKISLVNKKPLLEEGKYPTKYNEIIANNKHYIGEKIILEANEIMYLDKVEIYNNQLVLEVVGITFSSVLLNDDKYYFDYSLIEKYLSEETLKINNKTLKDYYSLLKIDNYKYLAFINEEDIYILKKENISYLSNYDYYEQIDELITKLKDYYIILIGVIFYLTIYYLFKILNKKIKLKESEMVFLKAMGIKKKKIINLLKKEENKLFLSGEILSTIIVAIIIYYLFRKIEINYVFAISLYIIHYFLNYLITSFFIKRRRII